MMQVFGWGNYFLGGRAMRRFRNAYLAGVALTVVGLAINHGASAASLDDVLARLDRIEQSNQKLAKENAALRERLQRLEGSKGGGAVAAVPAAGGVHADPKQGNPVQHAAVASTPAPSGAIVSMGGVPLITKGGHGWIDNTTVTIYGHLDLSGDIFNPSVFDQGTKFGIASNGSYFGVRVRHNLTPYGWAGYAIVAQIESQVDVSSSPNERAAFGTRDSYLGMEGPWGAIKAGKSDTPYKKSTAAFDPFANTLGDYNSLIGNSGGDNRAEFDWRMNHAIWYESPIVNGFQLSALMSPGQNYAKDNSDYSYGDYTCNGASIRGSGSNFPTVKLGDMGCNDGSFGNAYSAALTYKNGPFTAIAAYELHQRTNRVGDDGFLLPDGTTSIVGIHNEWAAKLGGGYRFEDWLGPLQFYAMYEWIRREGTPAAFNQRSKENVFVSATQMLDKHWSVSGSWAHAFKAPGSPECLSLNNANAGNICMVQPPDPPAVDPSGQYQGNKFTSAADQYAIGAKYKFNDFASWYVVASEITQGKGAHYCLGASGHGYQICSRDAANDTIGGATIKAVTTGLTLDF
jgi:predicted porin